MLRYALGVLLFVIPGALPGQRGASGSAAPSIITIGYSDSAFSAPSTLPAGYTTFRAVNHTSELHHATLIRLDAGKTAKDFLEAIRKPVAPAWATTIGGLQNGGQVTIELTPGNYLWLCSMPGRDGIPHFVKGMWRGFTVTATQSGAKAPVADIVVSMKDYGWLVDKPLTAGRHTLKVINESGPPHEFMLVHLNPGKTSNDFLAWLEKQAGPAPFVSIEGTPAMASGVANYVSVDLKAGRYMIVSFAPDARDGKSQIMHGMVRELSIR